MKYLILITILLSACAQPDHTTPFGVHIYNDTATEIRYEEFDFAILELVELMAGDTARLRGFEIHLVDEAVTPAGNDQVAGWVEVTAGHGEVEVHEDTWCFSATAFSHEMMHVLRGPHNADSDHSERHVWGGVVDDIAMIGIEQAVKRRGGIEFCEYRDDIQTNPGDVYATSEHWTTK